MKPRLLTRDEKRKLGIANSHHVDLNSLIPSPKIRISNGSYEIAKNVGGLIEDELGHPYEFYLEGFATREDETIRRVYLPVHENVTSVSFSPTDAMVADLGNYLREQRQFENWFPLASIHGHGRAQEGHSLMFSDQDRTELMPDTLRNPEYADYTSEFLERTKVLAQLLDPSIDVVEGRFEINDGVAYHPSVSLSTLSDDESIAFLNELGIDPSSLGDRSLTDLIEDYLRKSLDSRDGLYGTKIDQRQRYNYAHFLVFDNEGNHYSETGVRIQDLLTLNDQIFYREIPLEVVNVSDDIEYDEQVLRERIRTAFAPVIERQTLVVMPNQTYGGSSLPDVLNEMYLKRFQEKGLLPDEMVRKTQGITLEQLVNAFFHQAVFYLSMSHDPEYKYTEAFSSVINLYAEHKQPVGLPLTGAVKTQMLEDSLDEDGPENILNLNYDIARPMIAEQILNGVTNSTNQAREMEFMSRFAFARDVNERNEVLSQYFREFKAFEGNFYVDLGFNNGGDSNE